MSSNARKVAELLADSKNISDVDNTSTGQLTLPSGTTAQRPGTSFQGAQRFNTTTGAMEFYSGNAWAKVSAAIAKLNTVTGVVMVGVETSLTLAGEGFLASGLVVNFTQTDDSIDTDVTVTPSSDTAASVTIPAAVYNNVTAGRVVAIKVTNSDGTTSDAVNETAVAAPTGGTVTTSGNFRIHTFTSSGTFTNTISNLVTQYLVIAGGGAGGFYGAGGGAGGYRSSVPGQSSGGGASAESTLTLSSGAKTVTVGAGASGVGLSGGLAPNGNNSVFDTITSVGGGGGGLHNPHAHATTQNNNNDRIGRAGGSSGGSGRSAQAPTGATANQGYNGGAGGADSGSVGDNSGAGNPKGGGGGGAGAVGGNPTIGAGQPAGNGGNGVSSNITGSAVTRGGGGGGHCFNGSGGSGGSGGGGTGGTSNNSSGQDANHTAGSANTGGGGGGRGADPNDGNAPNGGSGIVIVRYDMTQTAIAG